MTEHPNIRLRRIRKLYSLKDFQIALSAADFLSECDPDEPISKIELRRYKSYETTMIVAYARPFSQSAGRVPRLSLEMIGANLTEDQRKLHVRLITLRNKTFAHSDAEMMRMVVKPFDVDLGEGKTVTLLDTAFDEGLDFVGLDTYSVIGLIRTLIQSLGRRLTEEANGNAAAFDLKRDYLDPAP